MMQPAMHDMPLAVNSYAHMATLADGPDMLNLAWTLDERGLLARDIDPVIVQELEAEAHLGLEYTNRYLVQDPYGERTLGPAIAHYFDRPVAPGTVTCAAGVVSVLHALARLPDTRLVCAIRRSYIDFPKWAAHVGRTCIALEPHASIEELAHQVVTHGASLLLLERPRLLGDALADLDELAALCHRCEQAKALVLIDESHANYHAPAYSAVNLVDTVPNLVVVRGFSKAYGLGSLRLAYCLASAQTSELVRACIPPLQPASLSLRIGAAMLRLGDIGAPLRTRIHDAKAIMAQRFAALGLTLAATASTGLPYCFIDANSGVARAWLEGRGILGKLHPLWSGHGPHELLYRLSVPLSAERQTALNRRLDALSLGGVDRP